MKREFLAVGGIILAATLFGAIQYSNRGQQPSCPSGVKPVIVAESGNETTSDEKTTNKEETKVGEVMEVTQTTFEESVLKSDTTVLVDFWAPWCGPCRMLGPIVEELAADYAGKLKVAKVNTDEHPGIAGSYGIRGIPTLIFFKDGKEVDRVVGVQPKAQLAAKIDTLIADN